MLTVNLEDIDRDQAAADGLRDVIYQLQAAKRIVVICGAGISTSSGIPDFRSSSGLFSSSGQGRKNGKGKGKAQDLFHVRSLTSSALLPAHHALLNELASMSNSAQPSRFHQLLTDLDGQDRLLRCYTQNIDGLEAKAGLEIGLPAKSTDSSRKTFTQTPRCIPLHGQLLTLHCSLCLTSVPLIDHLPLPAYQLPCPTCDLSSSIRSALSERQRNIGYLRASVVLYGEEHPQGELIGSAVERDLKGTGRVAEKEGKVDFLLVAGTSLSIPGVKRIVKEMARALHTRKAGLPRVVLVNRELPKGAGWEGVFDTFIAGDIQDFAVRCSEPTSFQGLTATTTTLKKSKVDTTPKKVVALANPYPTPSPTPTRKRPRMADPVSEGPVTPSKRKAVTKSSLGRSECPPTPQSLEKGQSQYVDICASPLSHRSSPLHGEDFEL